jgi:hypothetical protein
MRIALLFVVLASACGGGDSACVQSLFQNWHVVSSSSASGVQPIPVVSFVGLRYGAGQGFSVTNGCSYALDIEKSTSSATSEQGSIILSNPTPANATCSPAAVTTAYTLSCTQLSLSSSALISTYEPG